MKMPRPRMSLREKLEKYTLRSDQENCWIWIGPKFRYGYGKLDLCVNHKNKTFSAHRCAWENAFGPIPTGLLVCHRCDNPLCVNPDHLFLGTNKENSQDMVLKGRSLKGDKNPLRIHPELVRRGELIHTSVIKECDVHMIRKMYSKSMSVKEIAYKLGVTKKIVYNVLGGRAWAWLKEKTEI